ncbi:MAG: thiamine-phosphate kinase [Proteobacteria bacterium]|nr:thiamine-phosphate kinase [Pseudomonadota bacterium]
MSIDKTLNDISEIALISSFSRILPRSPYSVNETHTSDSEILDIGLGTNYLAATTDIISEEITEGLYSDPHLIGWMAMVVNLSDLAAVGAKPIGMLLSMTVSPDWDKAFVEKIVHGMAEACKAHDCGSIGGDYNTGVPALGATALGLVDKNSVMKRTGMNPGDLVYLSGPVGLGNTFVVTKLLFPDLTDKYPYKPIARIKEAQIISKYATSCMDTSDGLMFTIDSLYRLNSVAISIDDVDSISHPAVKMLGEFGIPALSFLSGIHGEFELCFTIPPEKEEAFLKEMNSNQFTPVKAGTVYSNIDSQKGVFINNTLFPSTAARNLWETSKSTGDYSMKLIKIITDFLKN